MGRISKSGSTSQITLPNGSTIKQDASGNIGIYNTGGTEVAYFDSQGALVITGDENITGTLFQIAAGPTTAAGFRFNVPTGKSFTFYTNALSAVRFAAGILSIFNGINTAGLGVSAVYASSIQSQSNAAPTTVSYTPPATAGTYRITANLEITTATTITFKNKLTYTSASGATTTDRPVWERQNSATILAEPTANTADRFVMEPYQFTIDNSAGAIALADDAGTYTTCAYRLGVILEQLA